MAIVEVKDLTKIYKTGNVKAVDKVNFVVSDQEFLVMVGPSGCGKTSTLRMIAGLEDISGGEVLIDSKTVNNISPKDRNIAMVFQNYALYPHMTVFNNMAFGLKIRKYPKQEIQARVQQAAQILDIEELLGRKPRALSGGQRQRVAVGRAIVRRPKVFLFDEPLSNLDAKLRVQMRAELSAIHTKLSATMIYVTHDQVEAMTMGDRIVVMKDGLIQQIGAPLELYNHPVNRFVASFIGSPPMNIMTAKIKEEDNKIIAYEGSFELQLHGKQEDDLKPYIGKDVLFGIRPEDLVYSESPVRSNVIKANVEVIEPLGAEILLYVSTTQNQLTVRTPPRHEFNIGDIINLKPAMEKANFFDMETGRTIGMD